MDGTMNGSHARHYVTQAGSQHGAIVRFQEENAALRAEVAELRGRVFHLEAEVAYLRDPDAALLALVASSPPLQAA